ncbi:MAG: complex I subunit 5 family protein, partial [Persicimonas sp.]
RTATLGARRHELGGWGAPLGIELYADGLSVAMVATSCVVGLFVSLYARGYFTRPLAAFDSRREYFEQAHKRRYFWPLWLFLWASLHALFLSADLFNLYVTLELVGLAAVALVALEGSEALSAAMRYLLMTLVASMSYLLGVGLLYAHYGVLQLDQLGAALEAGPAVWLALALMGTSLLAKTALFPLHFWLPSAHACSPTPVSAVLSGLVVTGGYYLLTRLWLELFTGMIPLEFASLITWLGMIAILWGSFQALVQESLKMLVAYSTVAQLGYLFLIFYPIAHGASAESAWSGGVYYAMSHAVAKAAMFMAAGTFVRALDSDEISSLRGTSWALRMNFFAFAMAGLTMMGLPPSGGFIGKWIIAQAAIEEGMWVIVFVVFAGGLLAAGYVLRVVKMAFVPAHEDVDVRPVPPSMQIAPFLLALVSVFLGLVARQPVAFLEIGAPLEGLLGLGGAP